MELTAIIALIALVGSAVGTVVGAKVAVNFLQRAFERFEDDVWESIGQERNKRELLDRRISTIEGKCDERHR